MECIDGTQAHHWMIEESKGATSKGICSKCNETQKFYNSTVASLAWREQGVINLDSKKNRHQLTNLGGKETL